MRLPVILLLLVAPLSLAQADFKTAENELKRAWASCEPSAMIAGLQKVAAAGGKPAAKLLLGLLPQCEELKAPQAWEAEKAQLNQQRSAVLQAGRTTKMVNGRQMTTYTPEASKQSAEIYQKVRAIDAKIQQLGSMRSEVIKALAKLTDDEALGYLKGRSAAGSKDFRVAVPCLAALGKSGNASVADAVRKRIGDRDLRIATAALSAAADLKDEEARKAIEKALKHKAWQVRAAAIAALGTLGGPESVKPLVDRLAKEDGRLVDDIDKALDKIVGISLGGDQRAWKNWYASNKDRLPVLIEAAAKRREAEAKAKLAAKKDPNQQKQGSTGGFYGITTSSKKICYIVDISGSMSGKAEVKQSQVAISGAGKTPKKVYPANPTKLDVCKVELIYAIKLLPNDAQFNIVYYHTTIHMYQETGLIKATPANKAKTIAWIEETLRPMGGTNIYDALMKGFSLASPDGNAGANYRYGADTFFFMTDGSPGVGVTDTNQIIRDVTDRNRQHRVVIHAIAVGSANTKFLEELAKKNGGSFVHHGAPTRRVVPPPVKPVKKP